MWHKALETDFKSIFGIKKVLYEDAQFGREQDVLYCEVSNAKTIIRPGMEIADVEGKISILGLMNKNKSGFLSKQIQLAPAALTDKFIFDRTEQNIPVSMFEDRFNVYSVNFMYLYRAQYNPNKKKITIQNFFIELIKKIKGEE